MEVIAVGIELVALCRVSESASAAATARPATTLGATCADADASACNSYVIVVIAVEAFLWAAFGGVGESYSVADGDCTCRSSVRVDSIVAIAEAYRYTTVKEDLTRRVDAVVFAFEIMLPAFDADLSL